MKTKFTQIVLASVVVGILVLSGCKEDNDNISLPSVADASLVEVTVTSAVIKGSVLSEGSTRITARGICWSVNPKPTVADNKTIVGSGLGLFSGQIDGLTPGTSYYVRTYATNLDGTSYSQPLVITTALTASPATIETQAVSYISSSSAVAGGNIISNGNGQIFEKGICWSTEPSPTIDQSKIIALTGSADYILQINGLASGTTYHIRAYAINNTGVSYGPELTFKTPVVLGTRMSDFPAGVRSNVASFSIGNKIYMGLGINSLGDFCEDFWQWDESTDQWTQMADLPVVTLGSYTTFTINGKGYVFAVVSTNNHNLTNEFWEFDPALNLWTHKADLPTTPVRYFATGFSIGTKGFIGLGTKGVSYDKAEYYNDFWEWDQASDTWTRKADFAGTARAAATGFSIGNKGYIGTGDVNPYFDWDSQLVDPAWSAVGPGYVNGLYSDFWEYDQANDSWTRKADFKGTARKMATGFSVGNKGYIGFGYAPGSETISSQDIWQWDQVHDIWAKIGDFAGSPRAFSAGGSIGNMAYLAAGSVLTNENAPVGSILQDLWVIDLTNTK